MDLKEKERLFYKAASMMTPGKEPWPRPPFVPSRIQVLRTVRGDGPYSRSHVKPGEYECESNQFGAVSVKCSDGGLLGLYPKEYVITDWIENPHVSGDYRKDILLTLHELIEQEATQ